MPTLQELIEERRKKRLMDSTAVADNTAVDSQRVAAPAIKATPEPEKGLWAKLTEPEKVPGNEVGFNAETLRNIGRTPFQVAEGIGHTVKDVATTAAGTMFPLANIHPKFREQYLRSAGNIASMPQQLAQPIMDAFTGAGLNPLAGGANPIAARFGGASPEEVHTRYPAYGEASKRLADNPLIPALAAAGAVDLGLKVKPRSSVVTKVTQVREAGANGGLKNPWEMTKDEFNKEAIYRGVGEGSNTTNTYWSNRLSLARMNSPDYRNGKIRVALKRDVPESVRGKMSVDEMIAENERMGAPGFYVDDGLPHKFEVPVDADPHKYIIEQSLKSGKAVPPHVLSEYPDLAGMYGNRSLQTNKRMGYRATAVGQPNAPYSGVSPNVATALRTTAGGRAKSLVSDVANRVAAGAREAFEYEAKIRKFPDLQDGILVHKSVLPEKATTMARNVVVDVISGLDRNSYLQFQDMVNLRNHRMTALRQVAENRPVKLPNGITLDEVNAAIKTMEPQMTPQARAALDKHGQIVLQIGQDLVNRGVIPKESLSSEYFPNQVLGYLGDFGDYIASGGRSKMKVPYRDYAQKRQGSELPVETDYRRAMLKYLTAYAVDNATVDFLGKQVSKYDIGPSLTVPDPQGIPKIPRRAIPDGYTEYIPESAFKVKSPNKSPIKNPTPLEQAMMDELNKATGDEYLPKNAAVIPTEIADRFRSFGDEMPPSLVRAVNKATGLWKGWTIGAGGSKFTIMQLTGDAMNLFREDARAFGSVGKAAKQQATRGPMYQQAKNRGVVGSGFVGKEIPDIISTSRELSSVGSAGEKLANAVYRYNPLKFYRDFQIERENLLRLTKFIADMDRGMQPQKSAKGAREFTVDYNKFTPQENTYLRGGLAPFYAFAKQNTINWIKYAYDRPTDLATKFIAPYFAASLWNEEKHPEAEKKIPPWMRDQFYVILKSNDSTATVLTFATPLDDAIRKFGFAHPRQLFEQLLNTQMPGFEADTTLPTGVDALQGVPMEAVKEWGNILSPAVKLPIELTANYSIFSGGPIEKVGESTLPDSMKTMTKERYALSSLFRPYREVSMFKDASEKGNLTSRLLPIYEVDLKNPFAGKEFTPQEEVFNLMLRAVEAGDDKELERLFLRHGGTVSPRALEQYLTKYMIQRTKAAQR